MGFRRPALASRGGKDSRERCVTERGSAAVEFALVVPILLLMIFGIIDFGRLVATYTTVRSAAREAARYGSALGDGGTQYADCTGITNAALAVDGLPDLDASDVAVTYVDASSPSTLGTCGSTPSADEFRLQVRVAKDFEVITPLLAEFLDGKTVASTTRRTVRPWD